MKKQLLTWASGLLMATAMLSLSHTAMADLLLPNVPTGVTLTCPNSFTSNFSSISSGDVPSNVAVPPTTCQRILPLQNAYGCSSCTYTTSFSNGTPAPSFLPATAATNSGQYFALGKGQTIVTVTGTNTNDNSTGSCSFAVTLIDDIAPEINYQTPQQVTAKTTTTLPDLRNIVVVDEDCGYSLSQAPAAGSPISGSSVSVTFVATDNSGNASSPYVVTVTFGATTPYDGITVAATGGCANDGIISVSIRGVQGPKGSGPTYTVKYRIDGGPVQEAYDLSFNTPGGLSAGTHTITIVSIAEGYSPVPTYINRTATAFIGLPSAAISGLIASGAVGNGVCTIKIQGTASGFSFVFTGPNGYVFSNVYRTDGTYTVIADGVKEPGQYTLTASYPANNCGSSTTITQTVTVGGAKCD